ALPFVDVAALVRERRVVRGQLDGRRVVGDRLVPAAPLGRRPGPAVVLPRRPLGGRFRRRRELGGGLHRELSPIAAELGGVQRQVAARRLDALTGKDLDEQDQVGEGPLFRRHVPDISGLVAAGGRQAAAVRAEDGVIHPAAVVQGGEQFARG